MIRSFRDAEAEKIFSGRRSRRLPPDIQNVARRKLVYLDQARRLEDLRIPPANQLEALRGNRRGQHSIRINRQWRICFVWRADNADQLEIVDYHD
ncbi:MAG: type II toxin-antitoxin system RelE/ParE family toxin [Gammaproteobacteria bacterium]